jgi:hypothetical protein
MVSKTILAMLGMADIEEYFESIIEKMNDGHGLEAKGLFMQLSDDNGNRKGQKSQFFDWVETTYWYEAEGFDEMNTEMTKIVNYFTGKN